MKIKLCLMMMLVLASCSNNDNHYVIRAGETETEYLKDINACPKVHIRRNDAVLIQKEGDVKAFEIAAVGYSGYCYFNENVNKHRAVVIPKFKIVRLSDTDITDVHFSYYLETVEGPEAYLGEKTYFAEVKIEKNAQEKIYTAPTEELSVPKQGTYDLDVYLGLNDDISDLQFKK